MYRRQFLAALTVTAIALPSLAMAWQNSYHRLTTQWQGEGMSLDVINDGTNRSLQLAPTGNYSGQHWKITPIN